jgi:23S rRNA-/tRNA-specific pseudouridylate synthase
MRSFLPHKRHTFSIHTLYKRLFSSETPPESALLERWLQNWTASPPATTLFEDDNDLPTALSWARRRSPQNQPLPDALLHKLFRNEALRVYDPATNQVKRVKKDTLLPLGARLLFPQKAFQKEDTTSLPTRPSAAEVAAASVLRSSVIFENEELIAINKPPGLAVQGGKRVRISVDSLLPHAFPKHFSREPSASSYDNLKLVHRLDRDVTGVLLLGKGADATARLAHAFQGKSLSATGPAATTAAKTSRASTPRPAAVEKLYWAVVINPSLRGFSIKKGSSGYLDAPITNNYNTATATAPVMALTRFRVLDINPSTNAAWLELEPITGRKHQLRQHCARDLGLPILGDGRYGLVRNEPQKSLLENLATSSSSSSPSFPSSSRQKLKQRGGNAMNVSLFLHCRSIALDIQGQKARKIQIEAPVPEKWRRLFDQQGWQLPA